VGSGYERAAHSFAPTLCPLRFDLDDTLHPCGVVTGVGDCLHPLLDFVSVHTQNTRTGSLLTVSVFLPAGGPLKPSPDPHNENRVVWGTVGLDLVRGSSFENVRVPHSSPGLA
jgi:hypothetical protein